MKEISHTDLVVHNIWKSSCTGKQSWNTPALIHVVNSGVLLGCILSFLLSTRLPLWTMKDGSAL